MNRTHIIITALLALLLCGCGGADKEKNNGTKTVSTERVAGKDEVKIGEQIWMAKNLDVQRFRNGDSIPEAKTEAEWLKAFELSQPAWCFYENDTKNGERYGKLYNWFAVNDSRMLAPEGWMIPSQLDWKSLNSYCDSAFGTQIDMEKPENTRFGTVELIDRKEWDTLCTGNNKSGFHGLPGGYRDSTGAFAYINHYTGWWSSTDAASGNLLNDNKYPKSAFVFIMTLIGKDYHNVASQACGFSVRCVR